jgi:sulfatase modifying factor 1
MLQPEPAAPELSTHACCSPPAGVGLASDKRAGRQFRPVIGVAELRRITTQTPAPEEMVRIPAATFTMGNPRDDGYPADGEQPTHRVRLAAILMDRTTVTNRAFAAFVEATGFVTESERYGWSFVFGGLLPDDFPDTRAVAGAPWWRQVHEADWRHPEGPRSTIDDRLDHPVVHVAWTDATAFAAWRGKRLPTEAEWEHAARGGLDGVAYPWGSEREPEGRHRMNVFQGTFPTENTGADGYLGTAPADSFEPNGFGLYQMTGNVWEWCADWFDAGSYARSSAGDHRGPTSGTNRVQRGGSYLCHDSYCFRYRVDSRSSNTPDSAAGNVGFRCVRDG